MFKIGTLADWFGVGLIEGIRESERCGAQGVQVYVDSEMNPTQGGALNPLTATLPEIREVARVTRECHQQVVALCGELGGYGLQLEEDNTWKIPYLKCAVDMGLELDCNVVTTHIGVVPDDPDDPQYKRMRDACQEIGAFAARRGSCLAIETGPETVAVLRRFVDDCGPGVAINYDPANLVTVTADDEVAGVAIAGETIVHTHAKDGVKNMPVSAAEFYGVFAEGGLEALGKTNYYTETPLGQGSVRWPEYLRALQSIGYNGYLTIEREIKNGAEDIRLAVRFLQETIAAL